MKALSWGAVLLVVLGTALFFGQPFLPELAASTDVSIQPVDEPAQPVLRRESGWLEGESLSLQILLTLAYEVPIEQLVIKVELPEGLYDVVVRTRDGDASRALGQALEAKFGWEAVRETSEEDVYVLKALPDRERPIAPDKLFGTSKSEFYCSQGELTGSDLTTGKMATYLSTLVRSPVVDETGLDDRLTVDLHWEPYNLEALISTLKDEAGLELAPAVRAVEMVTIRPSSSAD